MNRAVCVISGWVDNLHYIDLDGAPKKLPLFGKIGSFDSLVKQFSGDITYGAVLDELVRVGVVSFDKKKKQVCFRFKK